MTADAMFKSQPRDSRGLFVPMEPANRATRENRFWLKVDRGPISECWAWLGCKNDKGYGCVKFYSRTGPTKKAHRVAYELTRGPIPQGLVTDHLCHNPACVNPYHLEVVTVRENTLRGKSFAAANAKLTHCHKGHSLSPTNIYYSGNGRRCKTCWAARQKIYRARRKQRRLLVNA